ncbi:hypothetical protein JCM10213_005405 [Rhodosporidiobolus nylandii]
MKIPFVPNFPLTTLRFGSLAADAPAVPPRPRAVSSDAPDPLDPFTLTPILCDRLLDETLLPYLPRAGGTKRPISTPPQWTLELEAWFQTIHPDAWAPLAADDRADWETAQELASQLRLREPPQTSSWRDEPIVGERDLIDHYNWVMSRLRERYRRVLALRYVRDRWSEHQQQQLGVVDDAEIIKTAEVGSLASRPPVPAGTVWPLPTVPPPKAKVIPGFKVPYCKMPRPPEEDY